MYGQVSRRRMGGRGNQSYGGSVKLVRLSPHDSRVKGWTKRSANGRVGLLLLAIFLLLVACAGILYLVFNPAVNGDAIYTTADAKQDLYSKGKRPDPAPKPEEAPDIVEVVEDQPLETEDQPHTPLIAIDPGHGGEDGGCSRADVTEREINLELALLLAEKLQGYGFDTILLREDNETGLKLSERVEKARDAGADIYISIHQNADEAEESSASGIETWYYGGVADSKRLALLVHNGAVENTDAVDRGAQETEDLYVVREADMPTCLIETSFLSNTGDRQAITTPEYQEKLAAGMAKGIYYYFNPKTMYLTFDDGPSEENTSTVLDILKERDIKATFFVIGENVRAHPEVARRIVEEGHTIGIHCNRHDYDEIYESVDSFLADFQAAFDAVYEVTGVEVQLFRFPGGSVNAYNEQVRDEIISEMTARGFVYFDWNASLEDAVKKPSPEQLVENGVNSTFGRSKVVMLAHDIVYNTTLCLNDLIDSLPEYKMEPLTAEVKPIQFRRE